LVVETDNRLRTLTLHAADVGITECDGSGDRRSPINQTISISGPLDLGASAKALNRLIDAIETGEGCLSVDLDRVSSITTTGILVLDAAERHARRHHRQLVVVGAHEDVRSVIELVGLGRLVAGSEPARVA
jgi:anti-anti-sigma factor